MNWSSFVFAHFLKAKMLEGGVKPLNAWSCLVSGKLDIPGRFARIEIKVLSDFEKVIDDPPQVWCHEPWMRDGSEWHNGRLTGMCWVLEDELRDILRGSGRSQRDVVRVAATWLLNNVDSLVNRHNYADLVKLKAWPKEWDAWAHYGEGSKQYERSKQGCI